MHPNPHLKPLEKVLQLPAPATTQQHVHQLEVFGAGVVRSEDVSSAAASSEAVSLRARRCPAAGQRDILASDRFRGESSK